MELDIEKLLEVLKEKQREQEHTKENTNVKEELNDIIAHEELKELLEMLSGKENQAQEVNIKEEFTKTLEKLDKPFCGILLTNENTHRIGTKIDLLVLLSCLISNFVEDENFTKEELEEAFKRGLKSNKQLEEENKNILSDILEKIANKQ